jgi:hypothetical protein
MDITQGTIIRTIIIMEWGIMHMVLESLPPETATTDVHVLLTVEEVLPTRVVMTVLPK